MEGKLNASNTHVITAEPSQIVVVSFFIRNLPMAHSKNKQAATDVAVTISAPSPMGLEPYLLSALAEHAEFERMEKERIMDCIECGSCQFTCPANRPLLDYCRLGKGKVGAIIRARQAKN